VLLPAAQRRGLKAAADALAMPYFMAGLVVPQATLLYWLTNTSATLGIQMALADPRIRKTLPKSLQLPASAQEAAGESSKLWFPH
jgi:hypothetical protein